VCHVYPKRPRFASHPHTEPDADIDLAPAGVDGLERVPHSGDICEERDPQTGGAPGECCRLQFNSPVGERPSENAARHDAATEQGVRPGEDVARVTDIGARPEIERRCRAR